jgi:hypothetical protein
MSTMSLRSKSCFIKTQLDSLKSRSVRNGDSWHFLARVLRTSAVQILIAHKDTRSVWLCYRAVLRASTRP